MDAVVDANVFLHGRGNYRFDKALLVPGVLEEVKSQKGKNMLRKVDYSVREPGEEAVGKVEEKSEEINSPTSEVDEKLLALALETDQVLVTDDKPLQNLALHLEIEFEGYMDSPAEVKFRWENVCGNCGGEIDGEKCSSCGSTRLRRRQVRCSS